MAAPEKDPGSVRGRGSDILLPPSGNPFNAEARPTDLIPNYPGDTPPDPHGTSEATTIAPTVPDEDVAPGLPAWTTGGDPATPGTAPFVPPPDGAPVIIAPVVSAMEDGGPTSNQPVSVASKEGLLAAAVRPLLVDRLENAAEPDPVVEPEVIESPNLPANIRLARLLAPDQDLQRLWNEVGALERSLIERQRISLKIAQNLLTRLQTARNLLLNSRDHYEEAARQVAEVRFQILRWDRVKPWEEPRFLWWYLVIHVPVLLLAMAAPVLVPDTFAELARRVTLFEGLRMMDPVVLWLTVVSGGFGGVMGQSVVEFFAKDGTTDLVHRLADAGVAEVLLRYSAHRRRRHVADRRRPLGRVGRHVGDELVERGPAFEQPDFTGVLDHLRLQGRICQLALLACEVVAQLNARSRFVHQQGTEIGTDVHCTCSTRGSGECKNAVPRHGHGVTHSVSPVFPVAATPAAACQC